ncbi:MAG: hypothetical protein APF80_02535 [Alphaproteobacteria bacterium BRH_c36]|nr:MAG: hypothetical protein APF80_02535 [Alphaproteobacteria bacterium BRH_c36]
MIGKALTYTASRLASRAVDSVERRIVWGGIAGIFIIAAFIFALTASFVYLQYHYGTLQTALALTIACAALALIMSWMPTVLDRIEEYADDTGTPAEELAEAVDDEAKEAVDTFGPLQVATSAFMLGLSAARGLKKSA